MDRAERILEIVQKTGGISVRDLSGHFDVTEMTIRRDIEKLKTRGVLKMVAGAVMLSETDIIKTYSVEEEKASHFEEKQAIGRLAASLAGSGQVIYVDIGTTTVNILSHLPTEQNNTVIVSTENALREIQRLGLRSYIVTGGHLDPESGVYVGRSGLNVLKEYAVNLAFISAAGIDERLGVTCINEFEVPIKQTALDRAAVKCLVADSSKFGTVRMHSFGDIDDFDIVVTDSDLPVKWQELLRGRGIRLYLADVAD